MIKHNCRQAFAHCQCAEGKIGHGVDAILSEVIYEADSFGVGPAMASTLRFCLRDSVRWPLGPSF